jgi:YggT family protein
MLAALLWLFNTVTIIYILLLVVLVVLSWLVAFKVLKPENSIVATILRGVQGVTNPVLNPIRRIIPTMGGLDVTPIVAIILIEFLRILVNNLAVAPAAA